MQDDYILSLRLPRKDVEALDKLVLEYGLRGRGGAIKKLLREALRARGIEVPDDFLRSKTVTELSNDVMRELKG